jgi:hypothetical protein
MKDETVSFELLAIYHKLRATSYQLKANKLRGETYVQEEYNPNYTAGSADGESHIDTRTGD